MKKNKNLYLIIIVVLIISGLLGFSYYLNNKGVEASNLPKDALRDPVVREAYEYVVVMVMLFLIITLSIAPFVITLS
jgi:hypothetical protein